MSAPTPAVQGSTTNDSTAAQQPSTPEGLEQKILLGVEEASKVATAFSPAVGEVLQMGVAIEPVISGFVQMLIGIFAHHAGLSKAQ